MKRKIVLAITILLILTFTANGQKAVKKEKESRLTESVDSILGSQVALNKIPGAVILIVHNNKVILKHAYGFAARYDYNQALLENPEKMTVNHLFDIASLTKVIGTTTSVMLLADKKLINIDDRVGKYIPAFNSAEKQDITIRNLLTHTAGLNEWYPTYYSSSGRNECYKLLGELPLKYPVGKQRTYSDLGFMLLGEIIEIVSGISLEQFTKQNVFIPLGMKQTTYNPNTSGKFKKIASSSHGNQYERRMVYDSTLGFRIKEIDPASWNGWRTYTLRGEVNDGNTWYANGGISGAAGLFSTAVDLQKLVTMLLKKGKYGSQQFISEETINTFLTKDNFNNGLGWMMDPSNSFMKNGPAGTFGHTGFTGTSITAMPEDNFLIILLINRQNTGLLNNGEYYNVNPVRLQIFEAALKYLK